MPDYYQGYWDEAALRQPLADEQNEATNPSASREAAPMAPPPTYTNGNTFAGTGSRSNPGGVPMSDAAYRLLTNNGTQAIPTDRDVLGGGKFGVRGWMNDHPVGVMAAFIAAAAGGAALAPGGAGGAAGGAGGAGGAAGEAGGITGFGGAGTGGMAGNLATDLAGVQMGGGAAGSLAASGGIQGGAGAFGGGLGQFASQYGSQLSNLGGNSGNSGGNSAPMMMPQTGFMGSPMQPPMNTSRQTIPLNQSRTRLQGYSRKPMQFGGSTIWV